MRRKDKDEIRTPKAGILIGRKKIVAGKSAVEVQKNGNKEVITAEDLLRMLYKES